MTCTCSNIIPDPQLTCGNTRPHDVLLKVNGLSKNLRKHLKLLLKQYNVLNIEMLDDSVYHDTERHGRLMTREDRYIVIRYSNNSGDVFELRINEVEPVVN